MVSVSSRVSIEINKQIFFESSDPSQPPLPALHVARIGKRETHTLRHPYWCYPTGRCAYLPSVIRYGQSINHSSSSLPTADRTQGSDLEAARARRFLSYCDHMSSLMYKTINKAGQSPRLQRQHGVRTHSSVKDAP